MNIITTSIKNVKNVPEKYKIFSICLYPRGSKTENLKALAPSKTIFEKDKAGKYKTDEDYIRDYYDHIKSFDFQKLFDEHKNICFVCFCASDADPACHRKVLGIYLKAKFDINVKELHD